MSASEESFHTKSYLEIRLRDHAYAVTVELVSEIDQVGDITPLPNSAPHVCGLMNLRGQVIPVIDLKVRLGEPRSVLTRESCVVVVEGFDGIVGMLVDAVTRVLNIPTTAILPPPETCHLQDRTLVIALAQDGNRMVTLLNIIHCLDAPVKQSEKVNVPIDQEAVKLLG